MLFPWLCPPAVTVVRRLLFCTVAPLVRLPLDVTALPPAWVVLLPGDPDPVDDPGTACDPATLDDPETAWPGVVETRAGLLALRPVGTVLADPIGLLDLDGGIGGVFDW